MSSFRFFFHYTIVKFNTIQVETTSWFSRVGSSFRGGDSCKHNTKPIHHHYFLKNNFVQTVAQELQALQVLERDMTLNLESLRELRSAAQYSRTFRGRIIDFGQRIFAIYCMIRVVSVSPNLFFLS